MEQRALGCRIQPFHGIPHIKPMLGATPLPANYIDPAFRHLFDDNFKPIPELAKAFVKNQGQRPSCVGQSTSYQKGAEEGVAMSGQDIYRQAKANDGTDPLSYGTSLQDGQDAVVAGVCEYSLAPEVAAMSLADYVDMTKVTSEQAANRASHKGLRNFAIDRNQFQQTLIQFGVPIVTSLTWYQSDNNITSSGIMSPPTGQSVGGHAVCLIGWITIAGVVHLVFVNSWSSAWGDNGFFYVPLTLLTRFSEGLVAVDVTDLVALLAKYNDKCIKTASSPAVYHVQNGVKCQFPDEICFWAFGNLFTSSDPSNMVYTVTDAEAATIPNGPLMDINNAPAQTRELVREVRAYYGKL